jgi:hypothetical protein
MFETNKLGENSMAYKDQFRDYDDDLTMHFASLNSIGGNFTDESYHNDLCPLACSDDLNLRIWIDYKDLNNRDSISHENRYTLEHHETDDIVGNDCIICETNDWVEVLQFVAERFRLANT